MNRETTVMGVLSCFRSRLWTKNYGNTANWVQLYSDC